MQFVSLNCLYYEKNVNQSWYLLSITDYPTLEIFRLTKRQSNILRDTAAISQLIQHATRRHNGKINNIQQCQFDADHAEPIRSNYTTPQDFVIFHSTAKNVGKFMWTVYITQFRIRADVSTLCRLAAVFIDFMHSMNWFVWCEN